VYAITKRDHEELFLSVGRAYGIPTVALRYFNVYGPRQALSNPYTGVAAIFSTRLLAGRPPVIYEDGRQTRDFVHVRDIAQANCLVLEDDRADYEALNVGTGQALTIEAIGQALCRYLRPDIQPVLTGEFREGDIRHCVADISKLTALGYVPSVSFEQGLHELVEWVRGQQVVDRFEQAKAELAARGLTR
jgi:dTDP-L-rhamnose 4-epimerase